MDKSRQSSPFISSVRDAIRLRHYSKRTESSYVDWVKRFIRFNDYKHPKDMAEAEVVRFLSHLSLNRNVAPSTQNQALNALVFVYKAVLDKPLQQIPGIVRAKKKQKLPVVLTQDEIRRILNQLEGPYWLAACLRSEERRVGKECRL